MDDTKKIMPFRSKYIWNHTDYLAYPIHTYVQIRQNWPLRRKKWKEPCFNQEAIYNWYTSCDTGNEFVSSGVPQSI